MQKRYISFLIMVFTVLQLFAAVGKEEIRIRITEPSSYAYDETRVILDMGNRQFVATEDGQKLFDSLSSAPLIYSFSNDMVPCFSNSFGIFTPAMVIPLGFRAAGHGTYIFRASLIDNFDATSIIRLEDRALGVFTDLRMHDYNITLNQATQNDGRFFLHVSYPAQIASSDAGCSNNDGIISVTQDNSIVWNSCTVYDDSLHMVLFLNNATSNFSFGTLAMGDFTLLFSYGTYSTVKPVRVNGKSILSNISASTLNGVVGQEIQFFSTANNTSDYFWEFGDQSEIYGVANPSFAYMQPGVYTVTLTCTNIYGCTEQRTITVTISAATSITGINPEDGSITVENRSLKVLFNKPVENNYTLQVLNSIGQVVTGNPLTPGETRVDLSNASSGVYIVRITDGQNSFTKKVVLSQ